MRAALRNMAGAAGGVVNNNMIEATPSAPGAKMVAFNDCTWKTSCPAP
jgi:hypothetical protein